MARGAGVARGAGGARTVAPRAIAVATELAPLALVVVAEAAWISVVGGLFQEFALRDPELGIPALAGFVVAGIVAARVLGPRLGPRWLPVAFALVVVAGAAGWLSSPTARAALGDGLPSALAAHPGGWLVGLAVLRGFAHARLPLEEGTVTNLLAVGVPGLAFAATIGGLIGDPYRARFLGDALSAAVVYVGATVLALAFARLDAVGVDGGFDWRRNPTWLLFAVALVVLAIVVAIPLASVAGTILSVVVSIALGPLLILGLATGFDRAARRIVMFFAGVIVVIIVLVRLFGSDGSPTESTPPGTFVPPPPNPTEQIVAIGIGGVVLVAIVVGVVLAIVLWMRRAPAPDGGIGETRTIDASGEGLVPRRRGLHLGRRPEPRTAVEAYVALVDELARHPDIRRGAAETPASHAARLRAAGADMLSLDLLAADYGLARYGGVALPAREDRRAVGRWRRLRKSLVGAAVARRRSGSAIAPDADRPVDLEPRRTF